MLLYMHQTLWFSSGSHPPASSSGFFPCYASALCVTYGCCKLGFALGMGDTTGFGRFLSSWDWYVLVRDLLSGSVWYQLQRSGG